MSNAPTLMFDDKARRTSNFSDGSLSQDDRAGRDDLASAADYLLRRGYRSKSQWFAIGNARSLQGAGAHGQADNMIVLFTDFGLHGPYTGQMKAVLPCDQLMRGGELHRKVAR